MRFRILRIFWDNNFFPHFWKGRGSVCRSREQGRLTANRHLASFESGTAFALLLRDYTPYIMWHETDKEAEFVYVCCARFKRL